MLTEKESVEISALDKRGWSITAIAAHTGRGHRTVRRYLAHGGRPPRRRPPSVLEPYRAYLEARFAEDPHVPGTVLHRELRELGFDRAYKTFAHQLLRLGLRPRCEACRHGKPGVT